MNSRQGKLAFRANMDSGLIDTDDTIYRERTVVVRGLPFKVENEVISESFVKRKFSRW